MFLVWSKKNGKIKTVVTGGIYNTIKDLYPEDYEDYEQIYNCANVQDNLFIQNNSEFCKIIDGKIIIDKDKFDQFEEIKVRS